MRAALQPGRFRRLAPSALALVLASLILAAPLVAQSLRGVVVDPLGGPIADAEVLLVGTFRLQATTDAGGRFSFPAIRATGYWLSVRRIGYLPVQTSLTVERDEDREIRLTMDVAPFELPELVVTAERDAYRRRMEEFMWRARSSWRARFLTREDLERSRATRLGDIVIRHLPFRSYRTMDDAFGFNSFPGPDDRFATTWSGRTRAGRAFAQYDCAPGVAINGGRVVLGLAVNDFRPDEVEAVEIYRDGRSLPTEYEFDRRAGCGLVVVWLRSYFRTGPGGG